MIKSFRLSLFFIFFSFLSFGQGPLFDIPDSLKIVDTIFISKWENLEYLPFEDSTNAFESHRYRQTKMKEWSDINLGNNGSESTASSFELNTESGFQIGYNGYSTYRWTQNDLDFYKTNVAYSYVSTALGTSFANSSTSLQDNAETNAFYTRNFKGDLNTTLKYRSISEKGMYTRDQSKHLQVLLNINKWNKKKNFFYYLGWIRNAMNRQSNGGITNPDLLQDSLYIIRENLPIQYSDGGNRDASNQFLAGWKYYISQGNKQLVLSNTSSYLDRDYKYFINSWSTDSLNGFFTFPVEATGLRTTFNHTQFSNSANLEWNSKYLKTIQAGFTYSYENMDGLRFSPIRQYGTLNGKIELDFKEAVNIKASSYIETLEEAGDFNLSGSIGLQWKKIGSLKAYTSIGRQLPEEDLHQLTINAKEVYRSDLTSFNYFVLGGSLDIPKLRLQLEAEQIILDNFSYLDKDFILQSSSEVLSITKFEAHHEMKLWKFHLRNSILFQILNEEVFALPAIMSRNQIFFQGRVRKNGMLYRLGAELQLSQMENRLRFIPFTGRFIPTQIPVANDGWTYRVDPFAQVDIKSFSIFFKAENFQSVWWDEHFYQVEARPFFDWMLRVGIRWNFLN